MSPLIVLLSISIRPELPLTTNEPVIDESPSLCPVVLKVSNVSDRPWLDV